MFTSCVLWRKDPGVWLGDYFLPGCCLGDLAVISAKLNDLETQTSSQQTAGKNQLNGRGAVVRQKIHTQTHIYPQACTHTHIHTAQTYKNTPGLQNYHTHILQILVYPSRTITGFLWKNASIQMIRNRKQACGLNGSSDQPEKITSVLLLAVSTAVHLTPHNSL